MIGSDIELLRCYAFDGSESAFSELVRRHLNLVYSTALRQVGGDESTASDVVQTVFSDLACKARSLTGRASLAGWLYTSTHYAAAKAVRSEQRRRAREQKAFAMQQANDGESNSQWEQVQPILDRVMHELREEEREALVLRFFEQRDLHTVGQALGVSAEAARKRVDRSLEKLRSRLAKHGVSSTSAALCAGMSGSALTAAPLGLASTITTSALSAAASAGSSTLTLINLWPRRK
jgi:RNA polymerase sigma factor (sigma-70 family)